MTISVLHRPAPQPLKNTPRGPALPLVLAATSLPVFMATLDNLVMTTALPVVQRDLSASMSQLAWFVNAYTLAFATFMLPAAALGDRLGRRRMMLGGLAVFMLASAGAALSTSSEQLIAARTAQGLGAAAIMPLSLTLLAASVPAARRAMAIGVWGGISGLGIALGPVIGGAVVDGISWQAIFWLNLPVGALTVPLLLAALPESFGERRRVDLIGTALLGGAVFLGVWGIVHGNEDGWTSGGVLGALAAGAALLPLYVLLRRGRSDAVLPLRLFRSPGFSAANAVSLTFTLGVFGAVFLLSQQLQIVMGYSPLEAGVRTLPWTAAPMLVAPLAGALAGRTGLRALLVTGLVLQAGALGYLAVVTEGMTAASSYATLVPGLAMAGVGMGLTFAPSAAAVLHGLADTDFATASSANSTIREFGVALGVAVLTAVFLANDGQLTPTGYDGAIGPALWVGTAAVTVAALAALFAPGRTRP